MLNTNPEPLNAINIGINNDEGSVTGVMSRRGSRECAASASTQHNYANFGGAVCELAIAEADNVSNKIVHLREQKTKKQGGNIIDG